MRSAEAKLASGKEADMDSQHMMENSLEDMCQANKGILRNVSVTATPKHSIENILGFSSHRLIAAGMREARPPVDDSNVSDSHKDTKENAG